jgi:hypothetical protein
VKISSYFIFLLQNFSQVYGRFSDTLAMIDFTSSEPDDIYYLALDSGAQAAA